MAVPSVKQTFHSYSSVVIVLLLLSVTAKGQQIDYPHSLTLKNLFEEALMNSSENLWRLQKVYFNPSQISSPENVYLNVSVNVYNITKPFVVCDDDDDDYDTDPAFKLCDGSNPVLTPSHSCRPGFWYFWSSYQLKLADDHSGYSSQLSNLLTTSGSTGVFYTFDPSFYNIMKALSASIEVSFPFLNYIDNYNDDTIIQNSTEVNIQVDGSLNHMPCTTDAVEAVRMLLVWVSTYL